MATGRAGFFLQKSQTDEARKMQEQASKASLFGSIGSTLGTFALAPLLGPGASVAMKALVPAIGSTLGNIAARKIGGAKIDKGGLWYKGQKEQLSKGMDTQAITGGLTTALTAGLTPWLKGGMEKKLFSGAGLDRAGAEAAKLEKFITPATDKAAAGLTDKGTGLLDKNPEKFLRKTGGSSSLGSYIESNPEGFLEKAGLTKQPIQAGSEMMRDNLGTGLITDDLLKSWLDQNNSFLG